MAYLSLFACMLFFEARHPLAQSGQNKAFRVVFHSGLSALNSLILYFVLFSPLYAAARSTQLHAFGLVSALGLRGWTEVLVTIVVFDCGDYWMHRANHRIGLLWRFHKTHHSDMEIDVTTASRFHLGELLITNSIKGALILLWGPSLLGVAAFETLLTAASQFHHGNLDIPLNSQDIIEKIIVTPRMHRCHHVFEGRCQESNYATIFSVWDKLFGTYHWAGTIAELAPVGVSSPRGPETMQLIPLLLTPFQKG